MLLMCMQDDIRGSGVELHLNVAAESIKAAAASTTGAGVDDVMIVRLANGVELPADMVLLVRVLQGLPSREIGSSSTPARPSFI
jgi:hypothetical protein